MVKEYFYVKINYVPSYSHCKNEVEVELEVSSYAAMPDFKNATDVDTSQFAKKDDLTNLKSEIDKLDIDKLEKLDLDKLPPIPTDLSKLSNVVKHDVVKKDVYDAKIKYIEDEISTVSNLATNIDLNAK